jgi:uncharacterized repeat protein (TIGR01451 family)
MTRVIRTLVVCMCVVVVASLLRASLPTVQTGSWVSAGNLSQARNGACTVVLSDGRLLVSGGADTDVPTATADLFSTTGSWSAAASMNSPRSHQSCAVLQDGRVLVAGGTTSGGGITNSAEIYDPSANSWSQAGVMNDARSGATASVLQDGHVLIAGGQSSGGALNTLEILDPNSGNFSNVGIMSSPRQDHAAAVLSDGRVLIVGGSSDGTKALATAEIYDPQAGSVSAGIAMSTPRTKASATTLLDGTVVVIGGNDGSNDLATAEVFDPAAGLFAISSSLATARSQHRAFLLPHNNEVLVVGGQSAGTDLASAELYIPWQKAFQATGSMATPRSDATGGALSAVDGRLLVAGGSNQASAELYSFATVKTDQSDYPPGTTVTITGSGWHANEVVTLELVESPLIDTHGPFQVTTDASGNISNSSFVTDQHDLNVHFTLTATGSDTTTGAVLQAQTAFTDSSAATVVFTTDTPCAVTGTVSYKNNGGNSQSTSFTTGASSATIGTQPNSQVTYSYASSVVCGTTTYNFVSVAPTSPFNSGADKSTTSVTAHYSAPADLIITKTHTGNFAQGQTGASYTITVKNNGTVASATDPVTVTDLLPTGLTATNITGSGWICNVSTVSCTRSDSLAGGASYPAITLTVNVANSVPTATVTNTVTVSGGGDINLNNNTASDVTTIDHPDLAITKTHLGNFIPGQTGAYTIVVTNSGVTSTNGTAVTVTDTLPTGLTATAMSGTDWTCNNSLPATGPATLICTRSNVLVNSASYPAITLTVSVANVVSTATVTNTATVSGGGELNTANDTANDVTTISHPDLTISKTHVGNFTQGQTGAYSIIVTNSGPLPTDGSAVTVTDTLPTGLTATNITGSGWSCTLATLTCTRSNVLAAGSSYPAITLTVNIASNSPLSVTNTAAVAGGGEVTISNDTANDATTINGVPDLTVTKSHTGNFAQGQTGATYTIIVSNSGGAPTSGTITMTDTLPAGLTATAINPPGNWTCGTLTSCTRTQALAAGSSAMFTLTVNVASNASPSVTNTVTVSGGGETNVGNDTASDPTTIVQPDLTITKTHSGNFTQGQTGATYAITVTNSGTASTSGTVTVIDSLPSGLTAATPTAINGSGWICTQATLTCTRSDVLTAGSSYPAIILTVNVASNAPASVTNTATVSGGGETSGATGNNSASDPTTITVVSDSTPPVITPTVTGTLGNNGWYTSNVSVSWTVTDPDSAITSTTGCGTTNITSDTAGMTLTCSATSSGGTSSQSVTVKRDATAPALTATRVTAANPNGWNKTDVQVEFTCTDSTSGVALISATGDASGTSKTSPLDVVLTTEVQNQSVNGACTDAAGNSATPASISGINIDKTPPTLTFGAASPAANAAGWNNSDVTFTYSATDSLSGVDTKTPNPLVLSAEGSAVTGTVTVTDKAGNTATFTSPVVKIDKTPPTISPSRAPAANAKGWNNVNVTASFTCSDSLSGLAAGSPPADTVVSTEGENQSVNGTCMDVAGNSASATVSNISIDKTAPTATATPSPAANAKGWNNSNVTVTFTGNDSLSGIDFCTTAAVLSSEGVSQSSSGTCTDKAGNVSPMATASGINIDKTAPTATATPSPAANANGWNNSNVTVTFTGNDSLSGVDFCTTAAVLSSEGAGQSSSGTCTDKAGNVSPVATASGINIDKTGPTLNGSPTPAANANGWNNTDVTVTFTCTDFLSGVSGGLVTPQVVSTEGAGQSRSASCTDKAGNTSSSTVSNISIDKTAPVITFVSRTAANSYGWNNSNVTVNWSCSDSLSGPVSTSVSQTVSSEGANQASTGTCSDLASNSASNMQTGINIDKTPPTLSPTVSPNPVLLNGAATATANGSDSLSGIATQSCDPLSLGSVGSTKTESCNVSDKAGNTATGSTNYSVVYATGGMCLGDAGHQILQPINADGTSTFKQGSTVPAKFRVCDARGNSIGTAGVVSNFFYGVVNGTYTPVVDEAVDSTTPDTYFRWDPTAQQWIFNISTKPLSVHSTYIYQINLNDGSTINFQYGLPK